MDFLDPHPTDGSSVSFDDLANALLEQGELLSPAELHGCLCGLLGGGSPPAADSVRAGIEATLKIPLHGGIADRVGDLLGEVLNCLSSGELNFEPLLPDDSLELDARVSSLASWWRGFLAGFAQARVQEQTRAEAVAPDSAEALRDFAAIAQAESDREDEDSEGEYFELVEYLRVAVMNVLYDAGVTGNLEEAPAPRPDNSSSSPDD